MNAIAQKHSMAMELAEKAFRARSAGKAGDAKRALLKAFHCERQAANSIAKRLSAEPTRSVLLRSAATLALQCDETREAERLIAVALSGNPPEEIAEELRDLLEQVNFSRHLQVRGRRLHPEEFQLSISGEEVGSGMASADAFLERIETAEKMVYRTVERKMKLPFRELGAPKKDVRDAVSIYLSVPRAACFAVTVSVGGRYPQKSLPIEEAPPDAASVTDEVITCLDLYSKGDFGGLSHTIPQQDYRRNFIALARKLSPDGKRVKFVGLTRHSGSDTKVVALRGQQYASEPAPAAPAQSTLESVKGRLLYADELGKKGKIQIREENGKVRLVHVPKALMSDIVKPLWEDTVIVTGYLNKGVIELQDIKRADA